MSKSNLAFAEKIYTPEEYLEFEREAEVKHEFIDGEIVAMAGASREHNLIGTNLTVALGFRLRGKGCEIYANDMRVRMRKNRYGYPDVVVVCDQPQFDDEEFDVLLNPLIVIEILVYQKMESLRECLLIEQSEPRIEHYIKKTPTRWLLDIYENTDETINLKSVNCKLPVAEIYAQIEFETEEEE
jgi:Uma2 family endonuclease